MRRHSMRLRILVAVSILAISVTATPHTGSMLNSESAEARDRAAEQQLIDLERKLYSEESAGNTSAVLTVVSSEFLGWDSGIWNGRVQWVAQDEDALAKDLANGKGKFSDVIVDELEARIHGETGVVRGRALFKQRDGRVFETHFLDTWQ